MWDKNKMQQNPNAQEKLREVRGYAIISKGDTPQQTGKNTFTIPSQQGNGSYTITIRHKTYLHLS